jgi:hypothetical protein
VLRGQWYILCEPFTYMLSITCHTTPLVLDDLDLTVIMPGSIQWVFSRSQRTIDRPRSLSFQPTHSRKYNKIIKRPPEIRSQRGAIGGILFGFVFKLEEAFTSLHRSLFCLTTMPTTRLVSHCLVVNLIKPKHSYCVLIASCSRGKGRSGNAVTVPSL